MDKGYMRIGKYQLLELLGVGRYTDVWLAEHIDLKKKVAIKILFPQEVPAGNARLRAKKLFFNEAQTLAQLDHPHIVQVFDYEEEVEHNWSYIVMEYAPYGSLADRHGPGELLPLSTVKAYTSQMGRAIHYVHMQGLIHRDIKPQNMFLKTRNSVLLGDFGLVMRNHGKYNPWMKMEFGGTRNYMAPEQDGGEPCPASDQYAYATMVFEWLTGYWPYYGNARELAWRREHLPPPSMRALVPEIPAAVEWVVLTALQKKPDRRFKTMLDFTLEFEEACKTVREGVTCETSGSHSSRMPTIYQYEAASKHPTMLHQQRSAGFVPQLEFAEQADVMVAQHAIVSPSWQAEEDFWYPVFTSHGDGMQMILPFRWQNLWNKVQRAWERLGDFLRGSW
jgi:eukaryotic-like serine/threonine-protein kinase